MSLRVKKPSEEQLRVANRMRALVASPEALDALVAYLEMNRTDADILFRCAAERAVLTPDARDDALVLYGARSVWETLLASVERLKTTGNI